MAGHAKSHVVGPATDGDGMRTTAYRAVESFVCAQCGGAILPGHMFSRRSQHTTRATMATVTTLPVCVACRPLRVEGDEAEDEDEAINAPAPTPMDRHEEGGRR